MEATQSYEQMMLGQLDILWEIIETRPKYHTLYKNMGTASKLTTPPSVRCKIAKSFRENIREYLHDLGLDKKNFDMTPRARSINKLRFH